MIMKRYIVCLMSILTACSIQNEIEETVPSSDSDPPYTNISTDNSFISLCDKPTQYKEILIDGKSYIFPIFVMCDPNVSKKDLGDPQPINKNVAYEKISNPPLFQR